LWINGLAAGSDGSLYYTQDATVRKIDARGVDFTLATSIAVPDCAPIPGIDAATPYLRGLAVAADGTVYVAASGCGAVLKITPKGKLTIVLQTTSPWSPTAVAVSPSGVYVQEYLHTATEDRLAWVPRVRKILPNGTIVSIAAVERPKAP
jgi:DNA-binding beta-propeller fold protein YncE